MQSQVFEPEEHPPDLGRLILDAQRIAGLRGPLFMWGNAEILRKVPVSIGGSREAAAWTLETISALAGRLARSGACIVSGGAVGTDTAAHGGALKAGGATVVIPPCPLDDIDLQNWRPELAPLWNEDRVLFLSCFPRGTAPHRGHPLVRNRLVAALGHAAVVGETGIQGGTNHFLRLAQDRRLPLFFLDARPHDPALVHAYAALERRGAERFDEPTGRKPAFARRIIAAADKFAERSRYDGSAQLRWFEADAEYRPEGP